MTITPLPRREGGQEKESATAALGSVSVALRTLSLLTSHASIGVTEAAAELGISRSTAHRMLATLERHAFLSQDQFSKAYSCGPALTDIMLATLGGLGVGRLAIPFLQRIVEATGETAHLALLNGRTAFFIESVETNAVLRAGSRAGTGLPAECCSVGRALLSTKSLSTIMSLYPSDASLIRMTPASPTSVDALLGLIEQTRQRGWAENLGASESNVHAVAVPIVRGEAEATLAFSCTGPAERLPPARLASLGETLMTVAADFAAVLIADPRAQRTEVRRPRRKPEGGA